MQVKEKPKSPALFKHSQEYKDLPVEDSNDPLPSYSKSQYVSSPSAQVPGSIGTAVPSLSPMPPIEDEDNPADNANPLLPTRTRKNYIIFAVCTMLVIANPIALIVTPFAFQYLVYCAPSEITGMDRKMVVLFWFCYVFGVVCMIPAILSWWLMVKLLYYGQARPGPRRDIEPLVWNVIGPLLGIVLRNLLMSISVGVCMVIVRWYGPSWFRLCRRWFRLRWRKRRSELPEIGDIQQSI